MNKWSANNNRDDSDRMNPAEESYMLKVLRKRLDESGMSIHIQRQDPSSPLHSVKSFEALNLKPEILKGIFTVGFNKPSKIQENALPTILANPPQNMIAQSQSGTGKTAAFVIAMLSRVNPKLKEPQIICLSPTYELAVQTGEVAASIGQYVPEIKVRYAVSGEDIPEGGKIYEQIIIGTPGKVMDWALKNKVINLKKIQLFVLDEADIMISTQGHHDQCIRIHKQLSQKCQMLFFSATYDQEVMEFAKYIVPNPIIIRLRKDEESLDNIKQFYVHVEADEDKYSVLHNIYGLVAIGQAIVFCRTRRSAHWLAGKMRRDGHSVGVLSGELTVEERLAALDRYRDGLEKVLISTNVLSRGIDIEQVTFVLNWNLPTDFKGDADCETYLHRIGRTGRFGRHGLAINLIEDQRAYNVMLQIQEHFKRPIKLLNKNTYEELGDEKFN